MDGTIVQVRKRLESWGRGRIFFIDDFATVESQGSLRVALSCLVSEGTIIRLARGIYCYPVMTAGMSPRIPDAEMVAYALAAKERVRIMPYGDQAAYELGLIGMKISNLKYLTDGAPRKINLAGGKKIHFNHTSEVKIFDYCNPKMQKIAEAIRFMGEEAIDDERKRLIREHLKEIPERDYARDIALPPAWVSRIMNEIRNR